MKSATKVILIVMAAIISLLATCIAATAIDFPLPINGRLEFNDYSVGQTIKITNTRTGITEQVVVNANEEYLYDWSNSDNKEGRIARHVLGDKFQIEILDCSGECKKEIQYTGQPEIFVMWNLMHTTLENKIKTACECDTSFLGILGMLVALILSIGGGMQIYKNRKGGITILHRHRGIQGYHNPDTQHRNLKYRHAKLSTSPVQYSKDIKKIEEIGGLI